MRRIVIKNIKYPLGGNDLTEALIIIDNGIISEISKIEYPSSYDLVIDGRGTLALPGGIDIHAHVYDPSYTHHEDFRSGSIAAAFGGITTFYDMPLRMYVQDERSLRIKVDAGLHDSLVNFSVIAGMMNEANLKNVRALRSAGVKAFKLFTCKPFRPKYDKTFTEVIKDVNKNKGVTMIHAEDDALIDYIVDEFKKEGRNDPLAHHDNMAMDHIHVF